jgi:hypothetical protein
LSKGELESVKPSGRFAEKDFFDQIFRGDRLQAAKTLYYNEATLQV